MNNYLKVLSYLNQFYGDSEFHNIENVVGDVSHKVKEDIFVALVREKYILLEGGRDNSGAFIGFGDGSGRVKMFGPEKITYFPFEGKLTLKGARHLKEELEMEDKNKYHINVGDGSTANVIIGSPHATINNKSEVINKAKTIVKTIENDNSIDNTTKQQAIGDINQFIEEVEHGNPKKETVDKVLTLGSNISSIGSLVISLIQLLAAH